MTTETRTLAQWLAHCEQLHPKNIDMGLERVRQVADRMGLTFSCPVITVAGTNGKGSSCAMLESILRQAGYRTGLYTSPHLVHFEERLRLQGEPVQADRLTLSFAKVEAARCQPGEPVSLSYFEFTSLAILDVLAHHSLDVVILEVGLGGRLDAVNIIDPDCAIITSIDLDHMELLGPDREAIGFEKAGIMRPRRPVVVSDPLPPLSLLRHARDIGADLWRAGHDFQTVGDKQQWGWHHRSARRQALQRFGLSGAARCQPVAQRRRCFGGAGGSARAPASDRASSAQRPGAGGADRPLPDCSGPARLGARCVAQPAFGGSTGSQS